MTNEADFDAFVLTRGSSLLRAAWLLAGDWPTAEDLVQTALEKVWSRRSSMGAVENMEAYTRRVITTSFLRSQRRHWTREMSFAAPPETPLQDVFASVDQRAAVLAALARLPGRQRAVLAWRFFADLTEKETADVMGCGVGTVKSYTSRALATLREQPGLIGIFTETIT